MDITKLAQINESSGFGVWVVIKNPLTSEELLSDATEEGPAKPIRFKVCGVTSDRFYKLRDQLEQEAMVASFSLKEGEQDPEDEDRKMRLVAGMVTDIEGLEIQGRKCQGSDALEIFKTPGLRFIFNQLNVDIRRKSNFLTP